MIFFQDTSRENFKFLKNLHVFFTYYLPCYASKVIIFIIVWSKTLLFTVSFAF